MYKQNKKIGAKGFKLIFYFLISPATDRSIGDSTEAFSPKEKIIIEKEIVNFLYS